METFETLRNAHIHAVLSTVHFIKLHNAIKHGRENVEHRTGQPNPMNITERWILCKIKLDVKWMCLVSFLFENQMVNS